MERIQGMPAERELPYSTSRAYINAGAGGIHDGYLPLPATLAYIPNGIAPARMSQDLLFHYTKALAFGAIVESGCLWAGDLRAMNDYTELIYAEDLLIRRLEFFKAPVSLVNAVKSEIDCLRVVDVFSVSFSKTRELKSQWIGYAKENGLCFSLPMEVIKTAMRLDEKIYVDEIIYDVRAQAFLIDPVAKSIMTYTGDLNNKKNSEIS
ncbi:hypothetical protein ACFQY5_00035 [Paeniroseomonas aquatica]|uniref:hypothetical protein n=2 Tax=Paeniroseomonas aquatica TaxID=373043 RepID=UPI00361A2BC6